MWIKYGEQPSISQSYYALPDDQKFLYNTFCWCYAIALIIAAETLLMFFAGIGIIIVAITARYREIVHKNYKNILHMIGAYIGLFLSQLSILFDFKMWKINVLFLVLSAILFLLHKKYMTNHLWWGEILAFLSISYVLGIKLFS
jgi:hypothetical protein